MISLPTPPHLLVALLATLLTANPVIASCDVGSCADSSSALATTFFVTTFAIVLIIFFVLLIGTFGCRATCCDKILNGQRQLGPIAEKEEPEKEEEELDNI